MKAENEVESKTTSQLLPRKVQDCLGLAVGNGTQDRESDIFNG